MFKSYVNYLKGLKNPFEIVLFGVTIGFIVVLMGVLVISFIVWDAQVITTSNYLRAWLLPVICSTPYFYHLYKNK